MKTMIISLFLVAGYCQAEEPAGKPAISAEEIKAQEPVVHTVASGKDVKTRVRAEDGSKEYRAARKKSAAEPAADRPGGVKVKRRSREEAAARKAELLKRAEEKREARAGGDGEAEAGNAADAPQDAGAAGAASPEKSGERALGAQASGAEHKDGGGGGQIK